MEICGSTYLGAGRLAVIKVGDWEIETPHRGPHIRQNLIESAIRTFYVNDFRVNKACHIRMCHIHISYRIAPLARIIHIQSITKSSYNIHIIYNH